MPETREDENKEPLEKEISIKDAVEGLDYTEKLRTDPGDYILGKKIILGTKKPNGKWKNIKFYWKFSSDHNCASTTYDAGVASNVPVPSAYAKKIEGTIRVGPVIYDYEFTGNNPATLGSTLKPKTP